MKWLLFTLSVLGLFVANNALFWVPGTYDWLNFTAAGVGIALAAVFAGISGKKFARKQAPWKELLITPPVVIWTFVVFLFCCGGLVKILAYWHNS